MAVVHPQVGFVHSLTNVIGNSSNEINIKRAMFKPNVDLSIIEADGPFLVIYWPKKSFDANATGGGTVRVKSKGQIRPGVKYTIVNKAEPDEEFQKRADTFLSKIGLKVV